jgi:signal transduction histidine kinase/ActR/RegA family two-component response regulator
MSDANDNSIELPETPDPRRVLIVAPTGRDAAVVVDALAGAGIPAYPYLFPALLQELKGQAMAALIVAEEALLDGNAEQLAQALRGQPPWSDVPLIVLLSQRRPGGADPTLPAGLGVDGLALLLERPLRKTSLISTVRMVLRARRRQYEVRDHVNEQIRIGLELARAARSKDEFLAMLAHELRNPLGPIRNASELLQRLATNDPNIKRLSEMIGRQSSHMTRLLDGLLDVSRITRGKIMLESKLLDAKAIAQDAVEIARPLVGLREHDLRLVLPSSPLKMSGDATRLTQVLGNLLINSAKYTPVGGKITLTLESTVEQVVYRVRDNGIGIDAELMARIFDMFSQAERALDRSEGGLGIGLAVVKGIVELHKGSVSASSDGRGMGAEFVVRLPREAEMAPQEHAAEGHKPRAVPQRILIADDNADLAESMAMLLRLEGHEVRIALDGSSALDLAEEFEPNAALLDIGMPGLNGYELARELRSHRNGHGLLLIAATGYGQPEDRVRTEAAGFDFHMVKPLDPQTVAAEIAKWARERTWSRSNLGPGFGSCGHSQDSAEPH